MILPMKVSSQANKTRENILVITLSHFGVFLSWLTEGELKKTSGKIKYNSSEKKPDMASQYHIRRKFQNLSVLGLLLMSSATASASIFGEETAVLLQMLGNQLTELDRLSQSVGAEKDQRDLLVTINEGVNQTTQQIQSVQYIIERTQGVDPTSVRDLSDLNRAMEDARYLSNEIQGLVMVKMFLCDQAVEQASVQSDTSYKMGQEMANLGSKLTTESKQASPGRAQQISASASSAQMLAMGIQLQTLAQISQTLAMSLDLQKSQMEREIRIEGARRDYVLGALSKRSASVKSIQRKKSKRKVKQS